jgi:hypothetical protein
MARRFFVAGAALLCSSANGQDISAMQGTANRLIDVRHGLPARTRARSGLGFGPRGGGVFESFR